MGLLCIFSSQSLVPYVIVSSVCLFVCLFVCVCVASLYYDRRCRRLGCGALLRCSEPQKLARDTTYSDLWHGQFIRASSLIHEILKYSQVGHDSSQQWVFICATWLTHIWIIIHKMRAISSRDMRRGACSMPHSYSWHNSYRWHNSRNTDVS